MIKKYKKGDEVIVNVGKDKGKIGKIAKVFNSIDKVIISDSKTAIESIKKISPSIFFKGPDYKGSRDKRFLMEKKFCEEINCSIYFTNSQKYSTTDFIRKCQKIKLN